MTFLSRVATIFFDALFPPLCIHCQREGSWLCPAGHERVVSMVPLKNPVPIEGVDAVWCAASYDDPLAQKLIQGIKYHGWKVYAEVLPTVLRRVSQQLPPGGILIPVPLHPRRQRTRGFNQAALIAAALRTTTNLTIRPLLRRNRFTTAQATLKATQRETNLTQAFQLNGRVENPDLCGILVDDVITTGSTIRECASVLRQAGFRRVIAVALAKG